jgi:hypothetical protein
MGAAFFCREVSNKDSCNGLIGQAWAIEGLSAAWAALGRGDAIQVARATYYMHNFSEEECAWARLTLEGYTLSPDATFNHQL